MKCFANVVPSNLGISLHRVMNECKNHSPEEIQFVDSIEECDFQIVPVIGLGQVRQIQEHDKPYVMWQLCYLTTEEPHAEFWNPIWKDALAVFSYYPDLPTHKDVNFHLSSLGYDPKVFKNFHLDRSYTSIATGYVSSEHGEYIHQLLKYGTLVHVGGNIGLDGQPGYLREENISDAQMALLYNLSDYSVGIRYTEGFELPLLEGAACGCVPIALDLPCYRQWFDGIAEFVQRGPDMDNQVKEIITSDHIKDMSTINLSNFTWASIYSRFWNNLESVL